MAVLAGRVAVVTGASMGIGAGLAAMLAAEGIRRDGGTAIPPSPT
jgi:short-subunit dehydrogenase